MTAKGSVDMKVLIVGDGQELVTGLGEILNSPDIELDIVNMYEAAIALLAKTNCDVIIRRDKGPRSGNKE